MLSDYKCSKSQHPLDGVTRGDALIKSTYEAIRNSPVWNSSLFVIAWDEHGGFYDHVVPPIAIAPGDNAIIDGSNRYGFTFEQYGVRVPAVVISPFIPRNLIDHRVYDHGSLPATLEACFGLGSMTQRDANANNLMPLVSVSSARGDAPTVLPAPVASGIGGCAPFTYSAAGMPEESHPFRCRAPRTRSTPATFPVSCIRRCNLTSRCLRRDGEATSLLSSPR